MLITKTIEIDMGHRVTNHKSKCSNIHGHRYKIEVGVDDKVITTKGVSDEGMVIDFGDLKDIMIEVLDKGFDHGFMVYDEDKLFEVFLSNDVFKNMKICVVNFVPTAENISKFWFDLLKIKLEERNIKIKHVKVWETPTSTAEYSI
jgi:6-pyruvoyltetrahydropterin/6-carboxytetrahydropterin synthase